MKTILIWEYTS